MKQLYFLLILTLSFGVYSQGVFTYNFDVTNNTVGFKTAALVLRASLAFKAASIISISFGSNLKFLLYTLIRLLSNEKREANLWPPANLLGKLSL